TSHMARGVTSAKRCRRGRRPVRLPGPPCAPRASPRRTPDGSRRPAPGRAADSPAMDDAPPVPYVGSEIAPLEEVIVHRPGAELERLTPATMDELLWDDLLWVSRARDEHDAFVDVLGSAGVVVHQLPDLLTATLAVPEARAHVLDATFTRENLGPALSSAL